MRRSALIAVSCTTPLWLKMLKIGLANIENITATQTKKIVFHFAVFHTEVAARSGFLAPRFCPTNVAAAALAAVVS